MRTSRINKIINYVLITHQALLILLALADLGICIFLYLTLIKFALLFRFRVRLFLSGLPRDLRKSAYSLYASYVEANLRVSSIRDLMSLIQRD